MVLWSRAKNVLSLSAVLTLAFGLLGIYYTLRGGRTNLVVDVVTESNVLDVRTSVKDLAILFQGRDIQQDNANLKVLGIRLSNEGEVNILESYFDSRIPWGLDIDGGRVIEVRITGSNSPYLSENLHPRVVDNSKVILDKVIFDKGKYVGLELLVLHNKNVEPRVAAIGKVAGMDEIRVVNSFKERDQQGLLGWAFKGPPAVQIVRAISYFLVTIVAIIAIALSITGLYSIRSHFKKKSRRRRVQYLPKADSPEKEKQRQVLINLYVEEGLEGLRQLRDLLKDKQQLERAFAWRHHLRPPEAHASELPMHTLELQMYRGGPLLSPLVREGMLRVGKQGSVDVDAEVPKLLSGLLAELSESASEQVDSDLQGVAENSGKVPSPDGERTEPHV